jgi:hypothetical protein
VVSQPCIPAGTFPDYIPQGTAYAIQRIPLRIKLLSLDPAFSLKRNLPPASHKSVRCSVTKPEQQVMAEGIRMYVEMIEDMFTVMNKEEFTRCEVLVILNRCKTDVESVVVFDDLL